MKTDVPITATRLRERAKAAGTAMHGFRRSTLFWLLVLAFLGVSFPLSETVIDLVRIYDWPLVPAAGSVAERVAAIVLGLAVAIAGTSWSYFAASLLEGILHKKAEVLLLVRPVGAATVTLRPMGRWTKATSLAGWPRGTGLGRELAEHARAHAWRAGHPLAAYAVAPMARRYEAAGMTITRRWLGGLWCRVEDHDGPTRTDPNEGQGRRDGTEPRSFDHKRGTTYVSPATLLVEVAVIGAIGFYDSLLMGIAAIFIVALNAFWTRRRTPSTADRDAWVDEFGQRMYRRFERWGLTRKPQAQDLWAVAIAIPGALAFSWIYEVVFPDPSTLDSTTASRSAAISGQEGLLQQGLLLVIALVLVPLFEEIGWRGLVLDGLREALGGYGLPPTVSTTLALALSSAGFGFAHAQYNLHDQIGVAVSGVIYGLVFLKTRSVLAAALTHAAWNGWWVLAVFLSAG